MLSDQEYLQNAGIQDASPETPQTEPTQNAQEPTQTAAEMFELAGNKFPVTTEFNLIHGGKQINVPYSKLVNTYRQAAHMQDKWADFKKLHSEFETQRKDYDRFKGFYDKYGALQEWSEKNPQDWERLHQLWKNKDQHLLEAQVGAQPQGQSNFNVQPLVQELAALKQEVGGLREFKSSFEARQQEEKEAKDTEFVKGEVQGFAKEFKEIDMTEKDLDGTPLWAKIVNWGNQNGYREFTPAAHIYLKERIAQIYQARARAEAMKSAKEEHKNGIVQRSATPMNGQKQALNPKKMSYAELAEHAKSGQFATGT